MQLERNLLEEITRLRTQWMTANIDERLRLSNKIEEALIKIILTYEVYPDLKSDRTVVRLMDELAGTENRIAVTRTYHNEGVRDYNTHLRTFPNNIFNEKGFLAFNAWNAKSYSVYEVPEHIERVPKVNLTLP